MADPKSKATDAALADERVKGPKVKLPDIDGPDLRGKGGDVPLYPGSSQNYEPENFDSAHPEYFHRPSSEHAFREMVENGELNPDGTVPQNADKQGLVAQEASLEATEKVIEDKPDRVDDEDKKAAKALRKDVDKAKDEEGMS